MRGPTVPIRSSIGLVRLIPISGQVEAFWMEPATQRTAAWLEHRNINEVMLATSLMPDGYLTLRT